MKESHTDRLFELLLLSRIPDQLAESQRTELNDLLRHSEDNQVLASQFLMDGEGLAELLKTRDIADITAGRAPQQAIAPKRPRRRLLGVVALGACAVLFGLALLINHANRTPVAWIEDRVNARFVQIISADGQLKKHQPYRLVEGMATVRFRNGVVATIKAPAELKILNGFNVELSEGMIRAVVPESGQGFTVQTPAANVEDLGTEFAVAVDARSGQSEIHVFDGLVHVNSLIAGTLLKALEDGGSIRLDTQERQHVATESPESFPAPRDVSYLRWKQASDALRQDPLLLCYYTFETTAPELMDVASQGVRIDGVITGPDWVSGRWPEKRALLFDDMGDRVKLEVPGKFKALGFSAWVYVTDYHTGVAPIMNAQGWEDGDVHLQLNRESKAFLVGSHHGFSGGRFAAPLVQSGRWMHLAASIDTVSRECLTWVDGELASQSVLVPDTFLSPGICFLGDWVDTREEKDRAGRRGFKGRMDELAIWRRALTEEQVKTLYHAGNPNVE